MQQKYILLVCLFALLYTIKHKQPNLFKMLSSFGPIMYPGPVVNNIESVFKDMLKNFSGNSTF